MNNEGRLPLIDLIADPINAGDQIEIIAWLHDGAWHRCDHTSEHFTDGPRYSHELQLQFDRLADAGWTVVACIEGRTYTNVRTRVVFDEPPTQQ